MSEDPIIESWNALSEKLPIAKNRDPIVMEKRRYYKDRTIRWTLQQTLVLPYAQGTYEPVTPYAQMFGSYYWQAVREAVLIRDNHRCKVCGAPAEEIHHILFRCHGGTDHPRNLIAVCRPCHQDLHRDKADKE